MLEPTKKWYSTSKGKEKPQQDGRRGEITFRIKTQYLPEMLIWGLCVHSHQVVNFLHLLGVLASVKQLKECASYTVASVLQRGATAEDKGRGLS